MAEQLRMESERVHALTAEVNSLTAKVNSTTTLIPVPARDPNKIVVVQRKIVSAPAKVVPPVQQAPLSAPVPQLPAVNNATPAPAPVSIAHDYSPEIHQLNETIATTHEQLLALERLGARHYTEFKLGRTSSFQELGPLWVQVRKVNTKHGYYDISFIVDGHLLEKSHVNLYEPIWINTVSRPMQFQLVANSISKNQIAGYLSEPKSN